MEGIAELLRKVGGVSLARQAIWREAQPATTAPLPFTLIATKPNQPSFLSNGLVHFATPPLENAAKHHNPRIKPVGCLYLTI